MGASLGLVRPGSREPGHTEVGRPRRPQLIAEQPQNSPGVTLLNRGHREPVSRAARGLHRTANFAGAGTSTHRSRRGRGHRQASQAFGGRVGDRSARSHVPSGHHRAAGCRGRRARCSPERRYGLRAPRGSSCRFGAASRSCRYRGSGGRSGARGRRTRGKRRGGPANPSHPAGGCHGGCRPTCCTLVGDAGPRPRRDRLWRSGGASRRSRRARGRSWRRCAGRRHRRLSRQVRVERPPARISLRDARQSAMPPGCAPLRNAHEPLRMPSDVSRTGWRKKPAAPPRKRQPPSAPATLLRMQQAGRKRRWILDPRPVGT